MNKKLIELIKKHPDYEVIPLVDYEVVNSDEFNRWYGIFGGCFIGKYVSMYLNNEYSKIIHYDDVTEIYEYMFDNKPDMSENEIDNYIENLPWTNAIFVDVDLPFKLKGDVNE